LGKAICLGLEDVDGVLDLGHEFHQAEISIVILPRLEYDVSLPAVQ
jgi:hypothetical protein